MQIRVAEERDAATLLEIYSYYVEKTAITFEYETPSIEEFTQRIHDIKVKYPYIVAEENRRDPGICLWFCVSSEGCLWLVCGNVHLCEA